MKDGRRIEVERYWKDGGILKYEKHGSIIGIPLDRVARIDEGPNKEDDQIVNFGFDLWKFGTKIEDAFDIAERNDIPIHRDNVFTGIKGFNSLSCRPYIQTHSVFKYNQRILGLHATVVLTFTAESRRLALIKVNFSINPNESGQKNSDDVVEMLRRKYGKPHVLLTPVMTRKALQWRIKEGNQIDLLDGIDFVTLTYVNQYWKSQLEKEKQQQSDLKRDAHIKKDSGKF